MKFDTHMQRFLFGVALCAVVAGCRDSSQARTSDSEATLPASLVSDEVPGFGRSQMNASRDDAIALREAFQREELVQSCMEDANLAYDIEVAFPAGVASEIANSLDLPDPHNGQYAGTLTGVSTNNFRRAQALDVGERERYFQRLYAESSADMELVQSTNALPPGRSDFARGGCFGDAWNAIPGVYALKRKLASQIVATQNEVMADLGISEPQCLGPSRRILSVLAQADTDLETNGDTFSAECLLAQRRAAGAAQEAALVRVLNRNAAMTRSHIQLYENATAALEADDDFLAFLSSSTHGLLPQILLKSEALDGQ